MAEAASTPTAAHFTVRGRVQGVGFRYAAKRQAEALGVTGWVANRADGAVEAVARGAAAQVAAFEAWLRVGPAHARVDGVARADAAAESAAQDAAAAFQIRV